MQPDEPEDEYENWKLNSGYLYDRLFVNRLEWPSLSFQWLPGIEQAEEGRKYKYVYSTNTSGEQQEYLYVAELTLPRFKSFDSQQVSCKPQEKIIQRIEHPGEVNRVRYCVDNHKLLATKTVEGVINIYERGLEYPVQLLMGHEAEGYAMDWKPQGLLSGAYDGKIIIWTNIDKQAEYVVKATNNVEEVKWVDDHSFMAVVDGGQLSQWDKRVKTATAATKAHNGDAYSLDINQSNKNIVITGGEDHNIRLWDRRQLNKRLYNCQGHKDTVIRLQWSPHDFNIFCSGSLDHKVMVWDVMRIGCQVPKDDTTEGPNEILFVHSGHRGAVSDLGWSPYDKLIGSVEEEFNTLQIYEMADNYMGLEYVQDVQYQRNAVLG